jgi:SIR2-like domain
MRPDRFLCNNIDQRGEWAMQLVKLHGSVNWVKTKNLEIKEDHYHLSVEDIIPMSGSRDIEGDIVIYPLSQKQLYFTPYIQLFAILNAELTKRDLWLIIGYSFRDIIIRSMFERSLSENKKRTIILVHPHATDEIKPLFQNKFQGQIKCMDLYFARDNYEIVNEEIKEELSKLAPS